MFVFHLFEYIKKMLLPLKRQKNMAMSKGHFGPFTFFFFVIFKGLRGILVFLIWVFNFFIPKRY
jgi:hypothetical protein